MTQNVATMVTDNGISVFIGATPYVIGRDHPNFQRVKDALAEGDFDAVPRLMDRSLGLKEWAVENGFVFDGSTIEYPEGFAFSTLVSEKALAMMDEGTSGKGLLRFLQKVRENPSKTAQDELLLFCEANDFLIHEDGDIISYKGVNPDYTDRHSRQFKNHVGAVISMPRFKVDDNRQAACSYGFHTGSWSYASSFASNGRVVVTKVNPRDVVAIPYDSSNQKMRTCRYEVIAEVENFYRPPVKHVYTDEDLNVGKVASQFDTCLHCGCTRGYVEGFNRTECLKNEDGKHDFRLVTELTPAERIVRYLAGEAKVDPGSFDAGKELRDLLFETDEEWETGAPRIEREIGSMFGVDVSGTFDSWTNAEDFIELVEEALAAQEDEDEPDTCSNCGSEWCSGADGFSTCDDEQEEEDDDDEWGF